MLTTETKCLMAALLVVLLGMTLSMDVGDDAPLPVAAPLYHHAGLRLSVWVTPQGVRNVQQADSGNAATGTMAAGGTGLDTGLGGFFPPGQGDAAPSGSVGRVVPNPTGGWEQGRFSMDRGFDSRVSWD